MKPSPPRPRGPGRAARFARGLTGLLALVGVLGPPPGLASRRAAAGPEADATALPMRPYGKRLPGRTRGPASVVVTDEATGRPLAGARVSLHPEDISARARSYDVVLGADETDEHGVASVVVGLRPYFGGHALVAAPGKATAHEFGHLPETVALRRGVTIPARVVDGAGRPIAGARVEVYPGRSCPHGPATARHVTDAAGRFTVTDAAFEGVNLWIEAEGFASDASGVGGAFGLAVQDCALDPGTTVRGRVRTAVLAAVEGVVVRGPFPRGPLAVTDADGRFVLRGLRGRDAVTLAAPAHVFDGVVTDGVWLRPDVDADLELGPEGFAWRNEPDASEPPADGPDGKPVAPKAEEDGADEDDEREETGNRTTLVVRSSRIVDRVGLALGPDVEHTALYDGGASRAYVTDVEGPAWLVVDFEDGGTPARRVVPVDLPVREGRALRVEFDLDAPVAGERPTGPLRVHLVRADGSAVPTATVDARSISGGNGLRGDEVEFPLDLDGPSHVAVRPEDTVPLVARLETPGDARLVVPGGAIQATVLDADGRPVTGQALLRGAPFDVVAGRLSILGVPPGRHALIVDDAAGAAGVIEVEVGDRPVALVLRLPRVVVDEVVPFDGPFPGDEPPRQADDPRGGTDGTDDADEAEVASVLVDGVTGRPAAGAVLRGYEEDASDAAFGTDLVLASGVADGAGLAVVPWTGRSSKHWVALAPGRAPTHGWGAAPPARMVLGAGVRFVGRVVDPLDRDLAGARVSVYLGCGHGPTAAATRTDEDGRFVLEHAPVEHAYLWVEADGHEGLVRPVDDALDAALDGEATFVLRPAADLDGVVVDPAGRPVVGAVVRYFGGETRGPRAITDAEGRFRLTGVRPGHEVAVFHPLADVSLRVAAATGKPLRVVLAGHRPALPKAEGVVRVRVEDDHGLPVPDVDVALVGDDGRWFEGTTSETTDDAAPRPRVRGEARFHVPAGNYEVRAADVFAARGLYPETVEVVPGSEEPVLRRLVGTQARVVIEADDLIGVSLYAAGHRRAADDAAGVPAKGEVLVVTHDGRGVALSEKDEGGVRRATIPPRPAAASRGPRPKPEAREAPTGTNRLVLDVVDALGAPTAARVLVAGDLRRADDAGRLVVEGLPDGTYEVVIAPPGPGAGHRWRIALEGGVTVSRRFVLP